MKKVLLIFSLIIILSLYFIYLIFQKNKQNEILIKKPKIICGTIQKTLNDDIIEGKRQFNINCAMCHHLNKRTSYPVLKLHFNNYDLKNFEMFVRNEKRNRINEIDAVCMPYPKLSHKKIEYVFKYLEYTID